MVAVYIAFWCRHCNGATAAGKLSKAEAKIIRTKYNWDNKRQSQAQPNQCKILTDGANDDDNDID